MTDQHDTKLSIASNGVINGEPIQAIVYDTDDDSFIIFGPDIPDYEEFIQLGNRYSELSAEDQHLMIEAVKPVCLHCLAKHHPYSLEGLAAAKAEGVWVNDEV